MKLVIVDDIAAFRDLLRLFATRDLRHDGVVGDASNALRAIEIIRPMMPDVVLVNLDFSGTLSGFGFIDLIRYERIPVKILAVSGHQK